MQLSKVLRQPISGVGATADRVVLWRISRLWSGRTFGWFELGFLSLVLLALGMRLWELGGRAMHYDEAIHVHYAWRLLNSSGAWGGWPWVFGTDYIHAPWAHGPFQYELTALVFRIFGDSDFTSRLGYVLFGAALVALPYFFRDYLGRAGALLVAVMLALSPAMLYFSRFGRNDILIAFWATTLLILMWRYVNEGKQRYLYLASAVLAFMFATKETAYIVILIFGALMFLLALPELIPWVLGRVRISQLAGPAGFLLLLITLTLPQWTPLSSLALDPLGLTLANPDPQTGQHVPNPDGSTGLIGAPAWAGDFVGIPVHGASWWFHAGILGGAFALIVSVLIWFNTSRSKNEAGAPNLPLSEIQPDIRIQPVRKLRFSNSSQVRWLKSRTMALGVWVPLAAVTATSIALCRPVDAAWSFAGAPVIDFVIAGALAGAGVGTLILLKQPWRTGALLLIVPAQAALLYAVFLTDVLNVDGMVNSILPTGIPRGATADAAAANAIPVNYIVAAALLLITLNVSAFLGLRWLGGKWLICAGIFYFIWAALYTTLFTNLAGAFSGVWQGMGYWVAQQDVARGNQPWYYYFVGLSVYELLPVIFGVAGALYFLKKGDVLGLALTFWAGVTLLAYTVASEKMPWLLVNLSLPFILLSGKYLGGLVEAVRWRRVLRQGHWGLLLFAPLAVVGVVYLVYSYTNPEDNFSGAHWALLGSAALLVLAAAYLFRLARPYGAGAVAALGVAALLLGYGTFGALRAAYTFDDSNLEILVYAQGSKDLQDTFGDIDIQIFRNKPESGAVRVDYDLWYPFQWYVRDHSKANVLQFFTFGGEDDEGENTGCNSLPKEPDAPRVLLTDTHGDRDCDELSQYQRDGPSRNLLWFYEEAYRRPGENRQAEGSLWGFRGIPNGEQLSKDFQYFRSVASTKRSWFDALDYLIFRDLNADWYDSKFYSYLAP